MHRVLALSLRIVLLLALVLTGPGLSARAMASEPGHDGRLARAAMSSAESNAGVAGSGQCHDAGAEMSDRSPVSQSGLDPDDAAGSFAAPGTPHSGCCSDGPGCDCDCMHLSAPGVLALAVSLSDAFRVPPAGAMQTLDIASHGARLIRPPIA